MNTLEAIAKRREHQQFKDTKLTKEQIEFLIQCGLSAPSYKNEQPWYLAGVLNCELIHQLNDEISVMKEDPFSSAFHGAPAIILILGDKLAFDTRVDCQACAQNILLAAEDFNLASCLVRDVKYLNQSEKFYDFCERVKAPEGYEFVLGIALGYRQNTPEELPKRLGTWSIIE